MGIFLVLGTILVVLIGAAGRAFYAVPAADLACRNCTGRAQAVTVNGFDLYYEALGSDVTSAPVVLLHGGPGHASASFKHSFDFLAAQRRVIYYDQRGSGYSQIKPDPAGYTIGHLVEELEVLRRDVIAADKMVLVGHSAGGALAQRYTLAYGEHVEKLILIGSVRVNNGVRLQGLWNWLSPALFVLGAGRPPADAQAADAWFQGLMVESSAPRLYDPTRRDLIEDSGYISFATWREVSRSLGGSDFKQALRQLPTPTLIIYGIADSGSTGERVATMLDETLPNATVVRFEQSGHWPFLEEPERFEQVMDDFLESD